ncbi:hypothetical protein [Filimonas lacunae]|nr:hypothetical protein [Filimonas lacunae]
MQVVPLLAQQFVKDYDAIMEEYQPAEQLAITEHLLQLLNLARQEEITTDMFWHQYREREEVLLSRYGKKLKPYIEKRFQVYFYYTEVLVEKAVYSTGVYNSLPPAEQGLTVNEIGQFLQVCHNVLDRARYHLYLKAEPESQGVSAIVLSLSAEELDKEATRYRQLLTIYYLLKAGFGIGHRNNGNISDVVRLAHLLTGVKLTNLQNSDIYKKYSKMPDHKTGEQLVADLKYIRPFFAALQLQNALAIIDNDIQAETKRFKK